MGIVKEIWVQDIANNLYPKDSFILRSIDDSAFVNNGVVHLPQAGTKPVTQVNATLPVTIAGRTDEEATYTLDKYTTNPTYVEKLEEMELSYDKRSSILDEHTRSLRKRMHETIMHNWATEETSHIVRTTGAARLAAGIGATGNRKKVTLDDIRNARKILLKDDVSMDGLVMLIPAEMEADILAIPEVIQANTHGSPILPNGVVARLMGFDIYVRSSTVEYDNAASPKKVALGSSNAANNLSILCYHEKCVRRAVGDISVFQEIGKVDYYGDAFSTAAKAGGRQRYKNGSVGVVSIVEAHD